MLTQDSKDVVICECFCRDGLQHEVNTIATRVKVDLINRFSQAGFARIEATSYSNPKVIPQFADASDVLRAIHMHKNVYYKATCPNVRAVERAVADLELNHGANEISFLVSASESHSLKNLKRSRADQWQNIADMTRAGLYKFRIIGTISVAFGCPFEGYVDPAVVLSDVERFYSLGIKHVTLGDTTGMATPKTVRSLYKKMFDIADDIVPIAHFHDTRGTALVNYMAAYEQGVRYFDSAVGGVGGHPAGLKYGGGYTGNACTEDLVNLFESCGINTGIDLTALQEISRLCENILGRQLNSHVAVSGWNSLIGA